jgi:hypothetical protein
MTRRELGHKAAKDCPGGLDSDQCGALVEGFLNGKGATPHALASPGDCEATMSQAACEAMLGAQKAAAENAGTPVNVEECIENPTPRCEAVLGQMFEAQRSASEGSGG